MNEAVKAKYKDPSVQIIDENSNIHMAHLDIHYSHSVNGVARLHTEILKNTELNNFYKLYPEKFNNKTNGITFRRWVVECNPELTELISEKIGEEWKTDADQLEKLLPYTEDPEFLQCILNRKKTEKQKFAARQRSRNLPHGWKNTRETRWIPDLSMTCRSSACTSTRGSS